MLKLSEKEIYKIAQDLECGMKCYLHVETKKLISFPPIPFEFFDEEEAEDFWSEEFREIENNRDKYLLIEPMESHESFRLMEEFAETVDNEMLRNLLFGALNRAKPFRNFKGIVDDSGEYREQWFEFRRKAYEEHVRREIEAYNFGKEYGEDE